MLARRIEQPAEEDRSAAHLPLRLQPFQAQHHRRAVLADAPRKLGDVALVMVGGLDREMAVALGQRDEIAFGIDHDLLHLPGALLEQAAQQMRLARPRIALDEQPRRKQFLQVDRDAIAAGPDPHVHAHRHRQAL